jgi:putative oxidoreductase
MEMSYGILLLRVVIGATVAGHGTQKLFGWFGGPGLRAQTDFFGSVGFRPARPLTLLAAMAETGGLLFALGLVTPLAALGLASVMVVAVGTVHWKNGFWNTNGGFEFNLALWTAAVAVTATGPGRFSVDRALGWDGSLSGLWWGVGVALVSLAGGALVLAVRERQPEPEALEEPLVREIEEQRAVH